MTRIKVAVLDANGGPVPGLGAADFRVLEDGVEQTLTVVLDPADIPLDVALVIDFSASVDAEWPDPQPREAADRFLDALTERDCVYLLPFHDTVGPGVWGAPDDPAVRRTVNDHPYGWSTKLHDAIRTAHAALDERAPDYSVVQGAPPAAGGCSAALTADEAERRRAAIVILTDGEDTGSDVQYADVLLASHEASRPVFPVAVGMAGGQRKRSRFVSHEAYRKNASYGESLQDRLAELSRVSGGQLVTQRDIRDGYDDVLALLRSYYVLGYRTPEPVDEGWHAIQVEVVGDNTTVTQPGVYRSRTDYGAVRGALRTASEEMARNPTLALRMLEMASELAPEMVTPQFGRGVALERVNRLPEAWDAYTRALALSPGAIAVRSRLAKLALRMVRYDEAWLHALRVQRAGYDADDVLERLQLIAVEPTDRDERTRGPRVALPKPLTPDLEAQLTLRPVWRAVGGFLEEDPATTVVPFSGQADFILHLDLRELGSRAPRALELHIEVLDVYNSATTSARVEVDDVDDSAALLDAVRASVAEIRAWLQSRMDRRR
jgi:VWFA-related protein